MSGNCDKVVELECSGKWEGELCFDCNDDGDFTFGVAGEGGLTLSSPSGTFTVPSDASDLDFFQIAGADGQGATNALTFRDV